MTELEIKSVWALSTAHLREATCNEWLSDPLRSRLPAAYAKGAWGWFVHVPDPEVETANMPGELRVIFARARERNVSWIEFDADAPLVDDLIVFDW